MPLPKRKTSHAQTTRRRANNWKLDTPNVSSCPRCHAPKLSHHVCPSCGFYQNRMVIDVRARQQRRQATPEGGGGNEGAGPAQE
jgi:large subunit ribosomal protein L32